MSVLGRTGMMSYQMSVMLWLKICFLILMKGPGSGYASILRMDLTAVLLVDEETLKQLPAIVRWLHNHAPSGCKGGNGRVLAWMEERRGMDLGEAIKALPIAGTLHSVGGPGSGRFTFSPRGRVDDPMEQGDSSWIVEIGRAHV